MKKELYLRIEILEKSETISKKVAAYSFWVTDQVLEMIPDISKDKAEMFITHLAMAGKRAEEGTEENSIDKVILESVKMEPVYPEVIVMRDYLLSETDLRFGEAEQNFLAVHLCNLLRRKGSSR